MDKITASKFQKLLTCQEFFVWNQMPLNNYNLDDNDLSFEIDSFLEPETSISEIQAKSFNLISKEFNNMIMKNNQNVYIIKAKKPEDQVLETQKALLDKSIDFVLNPVFCYQYKGFLAFAYPALLDKKNNHIFYLKLSSSTKRSDLLKMWFDNKVIQKNNYKIQGTSLFLIATKDYKKHEVDFYKTNYINTSKTSRSDSEAKKALDYLSMQIIKAGQGQDSKGQDFEDKSIFEIIDSNEISISKKETFTFHDLDYYLDKIIEAKNISKTTYPTEKDSSIWNSNKNWADLVKKHAPVYDGFNGKFVSKKNIINQDDLQDIALKFKSDTFKNILNLSKPKIFQKDFIKKIIDDLKHKIVWYDFEAFSVPFCPLDGFLPYQQVVSQVSTIVTNGLKEQKKDNIVIDPKHINHNDLWKIIDHIYQEDHKYVVYNQSYENTRLKEMVQILEKFNHPKALLANQMVESIIDNTIDLADIFNVMSKDIKLLIPNLKGKHSIKLVEKYITNSSFDLPYKIKEYKNLNIKSGLFAMEAANNRALNITGDKEWEEIKKDLQEYCENDVRAMIMVYYLVDYIFKNCQ